MSAVRVAVSGDRVDLSPDDLLRSVQVAFIPHEQLTPAQTAAHFRPADGAGHYHGCRGRYLVLVIESGKVTHVWRCPGERQAQALWRLLSKALSSGAYPLQDGPSAVTLGSLEVHQDGKGRLALPGPGRPGGRKRKAASDGV